jgi:hypothetical protein
MSGVLARAPDFEKRHITGKQKTQVETPNIHRKTNNDIISSIKEKMRIF